jgi:hypothetical protein
MRAECRRGKALGEPYDGERHVRFDEGVLETGSWYGLRHRHLAKAAGNSDSPCLRLPRQRPTLQTGNVLNYLPKHLQGKARSDLHAIWMAATKHEALKAFEHFVQSYQAKIPEGG